MRSTTSRETATPNTQRHRQNGERKRSEVCFAIAISTSFPLFKKKKHGKLDIHIESRVVFREIYMCLYCFIKWRYVNDEKYVFSCVWLIRQSMSHWLILGAVKDKAVGDLMCLLFVILMHGKVWIRSIIIIGERNDNWEMSIENAHHKKVFFPKFKKCMKDMSRLFLNKL